MSLGATTPSGASIADVALDRQTLYRRLRRPESDTVQTTTPSGESGLVTTPLAIVSMKPLGSICRFFKWYHAGRHVAHLFLEVSHPRRIYLRTFDLAGVIIAESGWHGVWTEDTCRQTQTWRLRSGREMRQDYGDVLIELDSFKYQGMDAREFVHGTRLLKKFDSDTFTLSECSCGTKHQVTMVEVTPEALSALDEDVRPGMAFCDGFATR